MSKPKAPEAPNYAAAATAQGQANVNSAIATNYLNQADQVTPYGKLSYNYDQGSGYTLPDGTVIPHTTSTVTLSPEQQQLYNQNSQMSSQLNDLALQGMGFVKSAVENPLQPQGNVSYAPTNAGSINTSIGPTSGIAGVNGGAYQGPITTQVGQPSINMAQGLGTTAQEMQGIKSAGAVPGAQPVKSTLSGVPGVNTNFNYQGPNPFQVGAQAGGGGAGAGQATAQQAANPNVNLGSYGQTFGDAGSLQKGLAYDPYSGSIANGGNIQNAYNFSGAGNTPSSADFSQQRDDTTNLLMQRLQPYLDQQQNALDTKLANQGIHLGSQGYNDAQALNARNVNDQRIAAILAGSQEQQRLFQNAMGIRQQGVSEAEAQGQFGNAAQGQQFGQNATQAGFNRDTQLQGFNQGLASGQFTNQAQQQAYQQALGRGTFANQATQQANADAINKAQLEAQVGLGNAQLGTQASISNAGNQTQASVASANNATSASIANANLAQNAQQNAFNQYMAGMNFQNNAQQQAFGQAVTGADLYNQANSQAFNQGLASQGQQFSQNQAQSEAQNNILNSLFNQGLASGQFQNQAQQQQANQALAYGQFGNQAQQQAFNQSIAAQSAQNAAQSQQYEQALGASGFANQAQNQVFNQGLASSQFNNQALQQAIQMANYYQTQPLNLLNALRSGNQVTNPTFGNGTAGASIAPAPIYDATRDSYNAAMQAYQQQMAGYNGILGGLSTIGSAAVPFIKF